MPQQLQDGFRKPVFVGASPTRGSSFNGDHDVAASHPVKAFVPLRIRLVTPIQGRDVTVSISVCETDCAGANPVALTISKCREADMATRPSQEDEHKKLKAMAALRGQSIKDFVIERTLGADETDNDALVELEKLLDSRIKAAQAGAVSPKTASEVFAEATRKRVK